MSYILDALKKSEQDRGNGAVPGVQTVHSSSLNYHQEKSPAWPWFLVALVAINLAAVFYFIQSNNPKETVAATKPKVMIEIPVQKKQVSTTPAPAITPAPPAAVVVQNEAPAFETETIQQTETIEPIFETVDLYDLPLSVRQHIPALEFSAHVYSTNPLQRSLVINGRFMEEGSQLNNELVLTEITSDGAVFDFRGYRFSTSVLAGWN